MSHYKKRYHSLLQNLTNPFASHRVILDETGKASDFIFLEVNSAFEQMAGLKSEEMLNKSVFELLPWVKESSADWLVLFSRVASKGEKISFEHYFKLIKKWYEITAYSDEPGCFDLIMHDITDHKQNKEYQEQLMLQKAHFEALFKNTQDAIVYFDIDQKITNINHQYTLMFGYSLNEVLGKNVDIILDPNKNAAEDLAPYSLKGQTVRIESSRYTKSGQEMQVLIKGGPVYIEGEIRGGYAIYVDITERKQAEERLKFLSLHDTLTGIYNRTFFEEELNRLEGSREYPITIISADVDGLKLINDTMGHDKGDELLISCSKILKATLRKSDILARLGGDEFAVILPGTDEKKGEEIAERIVKAAEKHNNENRELLISISIGMATAKDSGSSLKDVYKQADDLMYNRKLREGTSTKSHIINTLMKALAERDYINEGHGRRVADYCFLIGEAKGLSSGKLDNLALLAQVHDLGKVGIPEDVLFKEKPLTEEEWEIMTQHSEKGYRIALSTPELSAVADLILKHHENWDGTGYPLGLKGEDIPLECRILAIADAFDAMTNKRPYKKAMSREKALAETKKHSGTQFDPELVEVFLYLLNYCSPKLCNQNSKKDLI